MLGANAITIELDGEAYELRPSLRACMRLARRHGIPGLLTAVQDFNFAIIYDVLGEASIGRNLLLQEIGTKGLGDVRNRLTTPLLEFILAVAGIDPTKAAPAEPASTPITPEQHFTQLYEIATGWLKWSPDQAWNATQADIIAAHQGRIAYLQLTGVLVPREDEATAEEYTPERLKQIEEQGFDPAFDRSALQALKAKQRA